MQENRLGTRLDSADSDGDGLSDAMEVQGFGSGNTPSGKWYSDPNNIDSNLDGLPDGQECWSGATYHSVRQALPSATPCDRGDSDGDGVPDLFDMDNDNDGVDDATDLSPFNVSDNVYDGDNPFTFQVDDLTSNEPLFVDLQLAPTGPDQVSYSRNVLDWPSGDTTGQVLRSNDTTFATDQGHPPG